ncbi:hypothetical protein NtRootC45_07730 [Arthrobacter sp. NtRootC45]|nr:hypothetical protein NtRootC45_07730 [Arthrobacter sp. NtRootC45]
MVMLMSAGATRKSDAMLGIAVVRIVPSRNSMKNVAATNKAKRGRQLVSLASSMPALGLVVMAPVQVRRWCSTKAAGGVSSIL